MCLGRVCTSWQALSGKAGFVLCHKAWGMGRRQISIRSLRFNLHLMTGKKVSRNSLADVNWRLCDAFQ